MKQMNLTVYSFWWQNNTEGSYSKLNCTLLLEYIPSTKRTAKTTTIKVTVFSNNIAGGSM